MDDRDTPQWQAAHNRLQFRPPPPERRSFAWSKEPLEEIEVGKPIDWEPLIMTLLLGARDVHSPLLLLRGKEEDLIQSIFQFLKYEYKEGAVTITPPAYAASRVHCFGSEGSLDSDDEEEIETVTDGRGTFPVFNALIPQRYRVETIGGKKKDRVQIAFSPCREIQFPDPTGININMMPFIMGDRYSLPKELWPYYDEVIANCPVDDSEKGDVMYLTVQESYVKANDTQRRPGLHIEAPAASVRQSGEFAAALEHRWGFGMAYTPDELHGGLYIASNLSSTTAVWDALVDSKLGAVDTYGGMDHLRPYIGRGKKLPANLLVWLTDRTPHEALPQEEDGYRQFFRLVTADISVWFAAHSTPNPKVPVPAHVKIIGESKFQGINGSAARNYSHDDFESCSSTNEV